MIGDYAVIIRYRTMSWVLSIGVLALLVFIHELGHFLAARWQGIHVNRFSIGLGPAIWTYQTAETEYALRLFPLGGYVGFPDDDPECDIPAHDPNLMSNRPLLDRAVVISAGVLANFVFAYLCILVLVITVGIGTVDTPGVQVSKLLGSNVPAVQAGLRPQDIILQARAGEQVTSFGNSTTVLEEFRNYISHHAHQTLDLTVQRQGQIMHLQVTPQGEPNHGKIGVSLDFSSAPYRRPIRNWSAFAWAAQEFDRIFDMTWQGLWNLINNFQDTANQLAGPVAIVAIGSELAQSDWWNLCNFMAVISINLGFMNLLPLPALDGGQLLFLAIEAVAGKPVPPKWQDNFMRGGLALLLGLGALMIIKDSYGLFSQYL
jgi:membrane-associated protease RseP (regulator of RpoE activity)